MKKLLVLGLTLLMMLSLAACKKEEEPEEIYPEHKYAENELVETTETEEPSEETTVAPTVEPTTETTTEEEKYQIEFHDMIYNTSDDVHMNDVRDMNTISIDGKLIALPCDYSYLAEKFDGFYTKQIQKYTTYIDITGEEVGTEFEIYTNPTTGDGTIKFILKSKDGNEVPITQMECVGFELEGGNYEGTKVFTCALPNWISFGSTIDEVYEYFGRDTDRKSYSKDGGSEFMLFYELEDMSLKFVGYDCGVHTIHVEYK